MHRLLQGDYRPSGKNVIVQYEIVPHRHEDFHACFQKTLESLRIVSRDHRNRQSPQAFEVNQKEHLVKVAFSEEFFEPGNLPQHLTIIAGTIFDNPIALRIRVLDIHWSESLQAHFPGPAHGLPKIRQETGIYDRPLSSIMLLPKNGITIKECIEKSYQIWMGGCDIVEDSEMMASTTANDFEERIDYLSKEMVNASKRTKRNKIYIPNITAGNLPEMQRRAKKAKNAGLQFVTVNAFQVGFMALDALRQTCRETGLFIAAHHTGNSLINQTKSSGLSWPVLAQIYRHLGMDLLHIGSEVNDEIKREVNTLNDQFDDHHLHQPTVMPICSGVEHAGRVEQLIKTLGHDLVLQAEQSAYDHPDGIKSGAEAFHAAIEAASQGITKERAALKNDALKTVLEITSSDRQL